MNHTIRVNRRTAGAFSLGMPVGLPLLVALVSRPFPIASIQRDTPAFAGTVLASFDLWDRDRDGALSLSEIDRAVLEPRYHGAESAALVALHTWLASAAGAKPPVATPRLTKPWFRAYRPARLRLAPGLPDPEVKAARRAYTMSPASLGSGYTAALRRLSRAQAEGLYAGGEPKLTDVRQGTLGDCYVLAPLGALVRRDPNAVRRMIVPELRGKTPGYVVTFGDGRSVRIAAMTDAELTLGGSATEEGLWVRVIEKAFGSRDFAGGDSEAGAGSEEARISRDGMNGGRMSVSIRAFTGHAFTSIALVGDFRKPVPAPEMTGRLTRLRTEIPPALRERRLVLASSPEREMPKSLNAKHAYAVFGYDAATDRITLWNPHGNDFTPTGPEGVETGYTREDGVFSVPLETFARAFARIYFERTS